MQLLDESALPWIERVDAFLDENCSPVYKEQPLAQDWARAAKTGEEVGEVIDALIGYTGQNPRKGIHGEQLDMLKELADVVFTGILGIQHFTKDVDLTADILAASLNKLKGRVEK